mmetsp:Transcript_30866/g.86936  ORF Transcript_30866/g.86936 Transcript_30866/m.86936 type:complete len:112 (+) Transcript_30866:82-417(+)
MVAAPRQALLAVGLLVVRALAFVPGGLVLPPHVRTPPAVSMKMASERAAEIKEVLKELDEFRGKIVDQSTGLAKKVKAKPKDLRKALAEHPDIIKIDEAKEQLEAELKALE